MIDKIETDYLEFYRNIKIMNHNSRSSTLEHFITLIKYHQLGYSYFTITIQDIRISRTLNFHGHPEEYFRFGSKKYEKN